MENSVVSDISPLQSLQSLPSNIASTIQSSLPTSITSNLPASAQSMSTSIPSAVSSATEDIMSAPTDILSAPTDLPELSPVSNVPSTTTSVMSGLTDSWIKIAIIILLLAFLGINLFYYLAKTTDIITRIFGPIFRFFGITIGETVKQTADISAVGAKKSIDIAQGLVDESVDLLTKQSVNKEDDSLEKVLRHAEQTLTQHKPIPDEAGSRTQRTTHTKSGYCYIGEDRGFRSCIKVNDSDKCMSGDIFPTMDICVNPSLRQ